MTNSIFSKAMIAVAAIAVTTTGFSAAASAQSRVTRTAVVEYSDLDLTTDAGRSTFNGRIKGAVRRVCGTHNARVLYEARDHSNCVEEANLSAKRASVTIMAAAATGKPLQTAMVVKN